LGCSFFSAVKDSLLSNPGEESSLRFTVSVFYRTLFLDISKKSTRDTPRFQLKFGGPKNFDSQKTLFSVGSGRVFLAFNTCI